MAKHKKRLPAWLVGLVIAAAMFAAILMIFSALGFGDDPVVESLAGDWW